MSEPGERERVEGWCQCFPGDPGQCLGCMIERTVLHAFGAQGRSYLRRHLTERPDDSQASMNDATEYKHPARDEPHTVRSRLLVTTVKVGEGPGHDYVHVWNRGGKSGTLVVQKGDGEEFAYRLLRALHE